MVIDGKGIAEDLFSSLKARVSAMSEAPRLGILVCCPDPVIESFVSIKRTFAERLGIHIVRLDVPADASTGDLQWHVGVLAEKTDAVIVQLPLPPQIDTDAVLAAIPAEKDVDAINPAIEEKDRLVHAPVATAILEILSRTGVDPRDKRVVVVGEGRLVGAPSARLLADAGARVSVFSLERGAMEDLLEADIIVSGAGNPGFIRPEHIRNGVVLIDAGTSESAGRIQGDIDPSCEEKSSVFTPVPGGVGPVSVAMIFKNLLDLCDMKTR